MKKGVVLGGCNQYSGAKMGGLSTGHATLINFRGFGSLAMNFIMAPGGIIVEDMITNTKKGLYINHFWYTRLVHARPCPRLERQGH